MSHRTGVFSILTGGRTSYRGHKMPNSVMSEMMKSFNGDGDVSNWLKKTKLVATLKANDLVSFLSLFLEGAAFKVFNQMPEGEKGCTKD